MADIELSASIDSLPRANAFVEQTARAAGVPDTVVSDLLLVTEEVFVNVCSYAYRDGERGAIHIACHIDHAHETVVMRFTDHGKPFDPLSAPEPHIDMPVTERPIGGLGIFLVRRLMDTVRYDRADGANELTLTKMLV